MLQFRWNRLRCLTPKNENFTGFFYRSCPKSLMRLHDNLPNSISPNGDIPQLPLYPMPFYPTPTYPMLFDLFVQLSDLQFSSRYYKDVLKCGHYEPMFGCDSITSDPMGIYLYSRLIPCLVVIVSYQVPRVIWIYSRLKSRSNNFNNKVNRVNWHWVKWYWKKWQVG